MKKRAFFSVFSLIIQLPLQTACFSLPKTFAFSAGIISASRGIGYLTNLTEEINGSIEYPGDPVPACVETFVRSILREEGLDNSDTIVLKSGAYYSTRSNCIQIPDTEIFAQALNNPAGEYPEPYSRRLCSAEEYILLAKGAIRHEVAHIKKNHSIKEAFMRFALSSCSSVMAFSYLFSKRVQTHVDKYAPYYAIASFPTLVLINFVDALLCKQMELTCDDAIINQNEIEAMIKFYEHLNKTQPKIPTTDSHFMHHPSHATRANRLRERHALRD